ncbi:MAG: AAA family ATPase [Hyphomicrobiaceae bacterium]|nr:AAA family ATPase [Hyphomicrobiaceae bacterium]
MFFKKARETSETAPAAVEKRDEARLVTAPDHKPLPPSELRRTADPATLKFETTADLELISGLIGQDRALKAIEFGASMTPHDFNVFVLGPPASGKSTAVKAYLERKKGEPVALYDWIYVNNFEDYNRPRALRLPCGRAQAFSKAMVAAIDELRLTVPTTFESDDYQAQRRQIDEGFRAGQEEAFEALNKKAHDQNVAILRTPSGIAMAPMHDGKVVKPEVFNSLPEEMRHSVEEKIEALQKELAAILETVPKSDKERREKLADLNAGFAELAVNEALEPVMTGFVDVPDLKSYLEAVRSDLIRNIGLFLVEDQDQQQIVKQSVDVSRDPRFRRYMINIMVASEKAADVCERPVVEELNPNYGNLIGRIEHIAQMGALVTDFLLVKPGALHRANGGFLLIDARKLLLSPFAWEALKRAIKAREIKVEQPAEMAGFMSTQTLDPEPIPLNVKVVLFGDRELYYMLAAHDPDFGRLFKVQADFDDTIPRSEANDGAYARLIASIVAQHELKHVERDGVARLIEEGARLADDREKLSIEIGRLADIVREADYWAGEAGRSLITRADIETAIEEHIQRSDRLRDRAQETISREIVMISTTGGKVGQINGLSVLQLGNFAFGRPTRITARVRMGQGRVVDIEREVKLGGPLHSKGVMILWGFLAGRYAQNVPLALAASLVFEQSYGGVDGDSASSTELYALLSALSGVPIKQGFAVTGSVNQLGEVQAIGGVNEKIEGYFDICVASGLTGEQGVLIPKANVQHLMLRPDVVKAVSEKRFAIHAVSHIDEGIEILTGVKAGSPDAAGNYPPGTINSRVESQLHAFATAAKQFGGGGKRNGNSDQGASA